MGRRAAPVELRGIDEGVVQLVSRGEQHHVEFVLAAVREMHGGSVESCHVGLHLDIAMAQVVEHQRVDDGMGFVEPVVGLGPAESPGIGNEPREEQAVDPLFQKTG